MSEKKGPDRRRILVTPSAAVWAVLDEMHTLNGEPKAAMVAEMLDTVAPVLQSQLEALRVAKENPREAQRLMARFAAEALGQLSQAQLELDDAIDARTVEGQRLKRRARRRAPP